MYYITTLFYKCIRTSDNGLSLQDYIAAAAREHESSIVYILTVWTKIRPDILFRPDLGLNCLTL